MKNKKLIAIVVLLVLIIILVLFFLLRPKPTTDVSLKNMPVKQENTENIDNQEQTLTGNISDLLKLSTPQTCTYKYEDEFGSISGTTYISGKKIKSENVSVADGITTTAFMISDGEYVYTWNSGSKEGFKMKLEELEMEKSDLPGDDSSETSDSAVNNTSILKSPYEYKCKVWLPMTSYFEIPEEVKFTDFSETLKQLKDEGGTNMCATCNLIQETEAKQECLTSFGCTN